MFSLNIARNTSHFTLPYYRGTFLTTLVASITLGLAGCNFSNSSNSPSSPDQSELDSDTIGPGLDTSDSDDFNDFELPHDGEIEDISNTDGDTVLDFGDGSDIDDGDSSDDGDTSSDSEKLVRGIETGVYTFSLQNLNFTGFQENESGYVAFDLASIREGESGVSGSFLLRDQLVMDDPRNNQPDSHPLHKVYVEEDVSIAQYFLFRSQLVPIGVSEPDDVDVNYSLGLKRTDGDPNDSSPWHGAWDMATSITRNTCIEGATGVRPAQTAEVRVIGDDFFIGPSSGPFTWRKHFAVDGDSITVDSVARRWLLVAEDTRLDFMVTLSQTDGMTGKVDGDTFSIAYQQEFRRPVDGIEVFCTIDLRLDGARVSDD